MIGAAAVLVLIVGAAGYFIFRGGPSGRGIFHQDETPPFHFTVGRTTAVSTNLTPVKKLAPAADQATSAAVEPMTTLYTEAFLDPGNWKDGSYDEVWPLFGESASAQAKADIEVLTLGTGAGSTYDDVKPGRGRLSFRVLMDDKGVPSTIVAIVKFTAQATNKGGGMTTIVSSGQYFLSDDGDGWRVISYEVTRDDQAVAASTPGASATPTAAAS